MTDWKDKAIELAKTGKSWRKVADLLGVSKSTVSDYLRKEFKSEEVIVKKGPRVLIYDIETTSRRPR